MCSLKDFNIIEEPCDDGVFPNYMFTPFNMCALKVICASFQRYVVNTGMHVVP